MDEKPEETRPEPDAESPPGTPSEEGAAGPARDDAAKMDEPSPGEPGQEAAAPKAEEPGPGRYVVQTRSGALPVTGTATATDGSISRDAVCVIRTNRGTEIGVAVTAAEPVEGDVGETVGHVLRRATARDLERQRKIEDELEPEELEFCRQKIGERGLRMRLSSVEHVWGGERIVFYFTSERRVDFRALVRDLAWHFHTRIELRQIGARDEAKLLADFEHCGRPLCCRTFLKSLEPVTMRMAKLQRMTLDPSKISGRCGRLMCCLRFEDAVYRELRKGLPRRGTRVAVGSDEGEVASTEILTQQVTVRLADGRTVSAAVSDLRPPAKEPGDPGPPGKGAPPEAPGRATVRPTKPVAAGPGGGEQGGARRRGQASHPSVRTKAARRRGGRRRGPRGAKPPPANEGGGKGGGKTRDVPSQDDRKSDGNGSGAR